MSLSPTIIFEDNNLLVLNKPAGMTVNKAESAKELTVQEWITNNFQFSIYTLQVKTEDEVVQNFVARAGIAHRLDKETSGVLLAAKNPETLANLMQQFKQRTVKKTYLTLLHGWLKPEEGVITASISRSPFDRHKFGIFLGGKEAETKYKVIRYLENRQKGKFSLVEAYPQTGRTHQIRVHFKYLNYPVVADDLYAGRKTAREDRKWCSRHFLHAHKIELIRPADQKKVEFVAPLPVELEQALSCI